MDVPVDLAAATWASEAVAGPEAGRRPGRLVELHLVELPDAAPAVQEGQPNRPADRQQLDRPDLRRAGAAADLTVRAAAPEAEPGRREVARLEALVAVDRDPACRMTARAVDIQLKAVACDVADRGDGQRAKHADEAI